MDKASVFCLCSAWECVCRLIRAQAYCNTLHTHMTKPGRCTWSASVRPQMGEALWKIGFATVQLHSSILWQKHKHAAFKTLWGEKMYHLVFGGLFECLIELKCVECALLCWVNNLGHRLQESFCNYTVISYAYNNASF